MKKALVAILAVLYISMASGVEVNLHYCMGKLSSVSYGHENEKAHCGKCGMNKGQHGCCHTEGKIIKLENDHQLSAFKFVFSSPEAEPVYHSQQIFFNVVSNEGMQNHIHSPPQPSSPLYLLHGVFRI